MLATDKQCDYLTALAEKVEKMRAARPDLVNVPLTKRNWYEERRRGMTTADASLKIDAYKMLIRGVNAKCVLLNIPQLGRQF